MTKPEEDLSPELEFELALASFDMNMKNGLENPNEDYRRGFSDALDLFAELVSKAPFFRRYKLDKGNKTWTPQSLKSS